MICIRTTVFGVRVCEVRGFKRVATGVWPGRRDLGLTGQCVGLRDAVSFWVRRRDGRMGLPFHTERAPCSIVVGLMVVLLGI